MENRKVVIDTNVFISSLIGRYGYSYKIFDEFVFNGEIIPCFSFELLKEYQEVPLRIKFKRYKDFPKKAKQLSDAIKNFAVIVRPKEKINIIKDKSDNMLLEIGLEAKAGYIITGNTKDFTQSEYYEIKILSPKQFYEIFKDARNR